MTRGRLLAAGLAASLVLWLVVVVNDPAPSRSTARAAAAAVVTGIELVTHPYKPPTPIPCDGSASIPPRIIGDVYITATASKHVELGFTFGLRGGARDGSDAVGWVSITRDVLVGPGTTTLRNQFNDQHFEILPAGLYFFKAHVGGTTLVDECDFTWEGA